MIITPSLHFGGNCGEAISLYEKALGLKMNFILHYSDASQQDWKKALTEEQRRYVYHSEGYIGAQRLMLADEIDHAAGEQTALFLTVTFNTADEVRAAFELLQAGGRVIYPLRSTTYSSRTGSLVDKFGFRWGLMTEQTER